MMTVLSSAFKNGGKILWSLADCINDCGSYNRLFSHCCMKLRLGMNVIISHQILNAIMEVLYELLYKKRFYM